MGKISRYFVWSQLFMALSLSSAFATVRIMPLGDSLTAGGYNENGQWKVGGGYRLQLDSLLKNAGLDFVFVGSLHDGPPDFLNNAHEGHSGWRIDQLSAQVTGWLDAAKPDVILLLIGTNDLVQNYDFAHAPARFEALLLKIEAASPMAKIFVSSVIPTENAHWNTQIENFNQAIQQIVEKHTYDQNILMFVDMYNEAGLHHDRSDLIDGVHPTPGGYQKMANVWSNAILELMLKK